MVGQGSQKNKTHKAGRRSGRSAREKHRDKKDASHRPSIKSSHATQGRADRLNAAKQLRDHKRAEVLEARRSLGPPVVVAILPLSDAVNVHVLWNSLMTSCSQDAVALVGSSTAASDAPQYFPLAPVTVSLRERKRSRFTFLPPLLDRSDPLAVVELGRSAEVMLCVVPGDPREIAVDSEGLQALSVLRAMGCPTPVGLVQLDGQTGMKERSAAKKFGAEAFFAQIPGDHKVFVAESEHDCRQIMRHLADSARNVPHWRRQRPQVMIQGAEFAAHSANPSEGTLLLTGYVRYVGISATQLIHIPTAGDFQIEQIDAPPEPSPANESATLNPRRQSSRTSKCGDDGAVGMDTEAEGSGFPILDRSDPSDREPLVRENEVDLLDAEQTWPTEEELAGAEAKRSGGRKRRLPKGTSDYQAAWILDDDDDDDDEEQDDDDDAVRAGVNGDDDDRAVKWDMGVDGGVHDDMNADEEDVWQHADAGTEADMEDDDNEVDPMAAKAARRAAEADDAKFPDEIDTPGDIPARERFARFRGLKSFRTSAWDPREDLPSDYSRVFAFENFRRAHKRAKEAASNANVPSGAFVRIHVAAMPVEVALRVVERVKASLTGTAPVLSCWGLLQHEAKLSVVNYALKKVNGFSEPVANKENLFFVTGLRSFSARPILSTDEHGADKHKMERFLHDGRPSLATVFAPISYAPLPLLVFKSITGGRLALAATGSLRDINPDRIVLKKIVLTGYPVRVHKVKAVVKFMFNSPEDVRWFRPVELYTKHGRRGRIREPVGTHGSMKCIFDGPVKQQDAVCMSLYKRVYPKWPLSDCFA